MSDFNSRVYLIGGVETDRGIKLLPVMGECLCIPRHILYLLGEQKRAHLVVQPAHVRYIYTTDRVSA